jgi:caffeoyl-CoA O-methyltransferase
LDLIHPLAEAYAKQFSSAEDEALKKVSEATYRSHSQPHMLSGHLQGIFLQFISKLVAPSYILEIGTYTGYSALALAKGLKPGGELHTIELRQQEADAALENFNTAGMRERIILHTGNALDIIPTLNRQWDIVFIDADKVNYTAYYRLILPSVRKGGVIIADNVLFHGEVLEDPIKGKNAKAIHAFNELVREDQSVDKLMLTIRDGLSIMIKK